MPLFNSSGSSTSIEGCGVPILSAEEVGRQLNLDPNIIDWLKKEPVNDDDPILVLSYREAFVNFGNFELNKQQISTALTNLGATLISDNVFKFATWQLMNDAHDQMWVNMPWCFYHPHADTAQLLNISNEPTITTTAISWFSEITGKLTIHPYEFFKL